MLVRHEQVQVASGQKLFNALLPPGTTTTIKMSDVIEGNTGSSYM
jgi:hypothetical protein